MEDLKESGGLEQDGDYVFLLDREYVRNRDSGIPPEETMLIIAKNKFGKTAKIELNFDGKYQNFTEPKKTNFPPYKTPKAPIMLDMGIIINRKSHDCICNRDWVGGDEGNRTPVRKNLAKGFSERSWCFKSPSVHRPSTGYALWQLLSCDRVRSTPLFTFTSNRRPLHSRGTLCRNEQHSGC